MTRPTITSPGRTDRERSSLINRHESRASQIVQLDRASGLDADHAQEPEPRGGDPLRDVALA